MHTYVYIHRYELEYPCYLCLDIHRYSSFHGLMFIAGLDVARTDRTLVFYEKQENLSKLWDILAIYAWFDSDVGYCQGTISCSVF